MIAMEERLICTNPGCKAEIIVKKNSSFESQNLCCVCGGDLKKPYQRPMLTVYGRIPDLSRHSPNKD